LDQLTSEGLAPRTFHDKPDACNNALMGMGIYKLMDEHMFGSSGISSWGGGKSAVDAVYSPLQVACCVCEIVSAWCLATA
jgi:hypothetical protein